MVVRMIGAGAAIFLTAAAPAPQPSNSYGDTLLAWACGRHHAVTSIELDVADKSGRLLVVRRGLANPAHTISLPLSNAMGEPVGTLLVALRNGGMTEARLLATQIGRRIYVGDNVVEPDPLVPGARRGRLAQQIVEEMVDAHPDLVTLAMHVGPSGGDKPILASNFGRIGKVADADDRRVIEQGAILKEITNGGRRLAVELPQTDAAGRVIGALSTSFRVPAGKDKEAIYTQAVALRDEIARATPSLEVLIAP